MSSFMFVAQLYWCCCCQWMLFIYSLWNVWKLWPWQHKHKPKQQVKVYLYCEYTFSKYAVCVRTLNNLLISSSSLLHILSSFTFKPRTGMTELRLHNSINFETSSQLVLYLKFKIISCLLAEQFQEMIPGCGIHFKIHRWNKQQAHLSKSNGSTRLLLSWNFLPTALCGS